MRTSDFLEQHRETVTYLEGYEQAMEQIARCQEEYDNESILIDAVRSLSANDGMPHGSGISKPTEDKAVRLSDKMLRLIDAKLDAIAVRQEIFDTIMSIGGLEADVLVEKYVNLRTWSSVCKRVLYSWPTVRAAWHRGILEVEQILYKNLQ